MKPLFFIGLHLITCTTYYVNNNKVFLNNGQIYDFVEHTIIRIATTELKE